VTFNPDIVGKNGPEYVEVQAVATINDALDPSGNPITGSATWNFNLTCGGSWTAQYTGGTDWTTHEMELFFPDPADSTYRDDYLF
jgi:hypothetical protein